MSASTYFSVALIQFLAEQDGDKTISQLMATLESEVRDGPSIVVPTKTKKDKKEKKVKKKRAKSAFQFFMGDHRPQFKALIAKFMIENPTIQPDVVVALLSEISTGKDFSKTDDIVSDAKDRLDELKSDGYDEWCTSNELDSSDFEGSFKGRLVMTMVTRTGGKVWHSVEDKSTWEDMSAEAKKKIAEEASSSEEEE